MRFLIALLICFAFACTPRSRTVSRHAAEDLSGKTVELQGHRGCRGLFPENSLQAFQHALVLGVSTLELDVVLTSDDRLVVSHEPWMSAEICACDPDSLLVIRRLALEEVQRIPCGGKPHPRFPEQRGKAEPKPSLMQVMELVSDFCVKHPQYTPGLNIEIKSTPTWQEKDYQWGPDAYTSLFLSEWATMAHLAPGAVSVQSFDPRILRLMHEKKPDLDLVYLTEKPLDNPEKAVQTLGFTPSVYSPNYRLVGGRTVDRCNDLGMKLIVWTVNEKKDMARLIELGVHGIITDYPNRALEVFEDLGITR